ncbi:MAG TPA: helix-turn-helix domain-containing protein [Thermoleophilaceae bacterium]|jgi:AcrR family transcriptional regulator
MAGTVQQPRSYRKRRRAEAEAETRRRITEATVELHREVGPARTTISAVAERAGVQRLTVYRHFPTGAELFGACSAHWRAAHPIPDPTPWAAIADPDERLRAALGALYAWYRGDEEMIAKVGRDAPAIPALAVIVADGLPAYLEAVRGLLMRGWGARGRRRDLLRAAIGHALDFETWRSLERRQGLSPEAAVALMCAAVRAVSSSTA